MHRTMHYRERQHERERHHHGEPGADTPGWHGRHGPREWRMGGRGPRPARARRGSLRLVILDALREPRHGYEIIKALEERTHGEYAPSPGTVYPTLQYLEDLGLVRAAQEGDRRVYELTDAGRAELDAQAEGIGAFWSRFDARAPSESSKREAGFLQDELRDLTRTCWGAVKEALSRGDRETIRNVRLALERCQNEVRALLTGDQPTADGPGESV
jgi:DNA-binding PadR family transcriptional regulator